MSWLDALFGGVTRIRFNGAPLPAESALNFTGDGVTVSDNPADGSTDTDIPGGGSGSAMQPIQYDYWIGAVADPPETPTGAQDAPFATAVDAAAVAVQLPSGSYVTFHVTQLDNTGSTLDLTTDSDVPGGKSYRIVSEIGGSAFASITADVTDGGVTLILDDVAASGISATGSDNSFDVIARGRGLALGNISGARVTSVYLDHVQATAINTPGASMDAYSCTITGNVDVDSIGRVDDTALGASAEDVRHFNVNATSDPTRQNFTRCQLHSSYSYTDSGGGIFAADDFTMSQWVASGSGFATGTSWIHLDAQSTIYNPELGSIDNNANIAGGTMAGSYRTDGDFLMMRIIIQQGIGTTFGTGNSTFTMPDAWVIAAPKDGVSSVNATLSCSSNTIGGNYVFPCIANPGGLLEFGVNLASFAFDPLTNIIIEMQVPAAPATA